VVSSLQVFRLKYYMDFSRYLLTPDYNSHGAVPLEELIVAQLVKKFRAFYGTLRFITVLSKSRPCSLTLIQFTPSHPISSQFVLMLSSPSTPRPSPSDYVITTILVNINRYRYLYNIG
jgi:hypothetical protein